MGDVLSQNEIDNLLAALSTGELDVDEIKDNNEKKVKEYDFARPSKFSPGLTPDLSFHRSQETPADTGRMSRSVPDVWNYKSRYTPPSVHP